MRKRRKWYKLKTILPALLVLPPLGLALLWISPRTNKAKIGITLAYLLLLVTACAAVIRSGMYDEWAHPKIPASGYDVTRNRHGGYQYRKVLPFERQIFNEVVRETRRLSKSSNWTSEQGLAIYSADPETRAFNIVAERHDLLPEDISAIYMKVSSQLAPTR